ncbi:uncharacterized protein CLUP02_14060 [Colletotrichum lupini]|uniref:Uncharacterized protein n=1 Tax=Colletotrichum lupini TaxID=145971 RepID=A0A9Q8WMY1_9PEZI|nr:uncharacterized protein CLUP02_14060 [Colletotrichum lupini]UQC88535.1 hypothetical protein CLUP02_14060 [Colletotrichum lupini]
MAGNFSRKTRHPDPDQWAISRQWWNRLLDDGIRLDRPSLHHIDTTLSCHWKLWWTYEYEDYAGEFWDMVQDEASKVPGAWVDDSWDPDDYDDEEWDRWEAWEKEQPPPLIWSEYRRVRPPV